MRCNLTSKFSVRKITSRLILPSARNAQASHSKRPRQIDYTADLPRCFLLADPPLSSNQAIDERKGQSHFIRNLSELALRIQMALAS